MSEILEFPAVYCDVTTHLLPTESHRMDWNTLTPVLVCLHRHDATRTQEKLLGEKHSHRLGEWK